MRSLGFERDPIADDLRAAGPGRARVNDRSILCRATAGSCAAADLGFKSGKQDPRVRVETLDRRR